MLLKQLLKTQSFLSSTFSHTLSFHISLSLYLFVSLFLSLTQRRSDGATVNARHLYNEDFLPWIQSSRALCSFCECGMCLGLTCLPLPTVPHSAFPLLVYSLAMKEIESKRKSSCFSTWRKVKHFPNIHSRNTSLQGTTYTERYRQHILQDCI